MFETMPPFFARVPRECLGEALLHFRRVDADYGVTLIEEGEEDASLVCLLEGEVEIRTGDVVLGKAKAGDLIGEMALFGAGLRMASVQSVTGCSLLVLDRHGYLELRSQQHPVAKSIEDTALEMLVHRLRDVNHRIGTVAHGTSSAQVTPSPSVMSRLSALFGGSGGRHVARDVDGVAVLSRSPIFAGAPEAALRGIAGRMRSFSFSTGHFLCRQGEYGGDMYVLAEGLVEVVLALDENRAEPLATLDPGDAFGMASTIEDVHRQVSCVSRGDVVALAMDRDTFRSLVAEPSVEGSVFRGAVIRSLTDQVAYANAQLAMLDIGRKRQTGEMPVPAMRAHAGMEAHSPRMQASLDGG